MSAHLWWSLLSSFTSKEKWITPLIFAACLWPSLVKASLGLLEGHMYSCFLCCASLPRDGKMFLYLLSPGEPGLWACDYLAITTWKLQAENIWDAVKISRWGLYNTEVRKLPHPSPWAPSMVWHIHVSPLVIPALTAPTSPAGAILFAAGKSLWL